MATIFTPALDCLRTWETDSFIWLAHTAATDDRTLATVADLLAACPEITVSGYARQLVDSPTRTIGATEIAYAQGADTLTWSGLAAGETVAAVTLCKDNGSDATSQPVAQWALPAGGLPTSLGTVPVNLGSATLLRAQQAP